MFLERLENAKLPNNVLEENLANEVNLRRYYLLKRLVAILLLLLVRMVHEYTLAFKTFITIQSPKIQTAICLPGPLKRNTHSIWRDLTNQNRRRE